MSLFWNKLMQFDWSELNNQQVGKYGEYIAKMNFVQNGCDVFGSEVDDRGIDFVLRVPGSPPRHFDVQVKTVRAANSYVFMHKSKFPLDPYRMLALVRLLPSVEIYLLPAEIWKSPNRPTCLKDRDYVDKKSKPEWGVNIALSTWKELEAYRFSEQIRTINQTEAA